MNLKSLLSMGTEKAVESTKLEIRNPNRPVPSCVEATVFNKGFTPSKVEFKLPDSGSLIFVRNEEGLWGPNNLQFNPQQTAAQSQEATSVAIWIESHLWGKPAGNMKDVTKLLEASPVQQQTPEIS